MLGYHSPMTTDLNAFDPPLPPERLDAIARLAGTQPPTAIRINTLKIDRDTALREWSERYGWQMAPVPFCRDGFTLTHRPADLSRSLEHRMGFFYIQDAASMLPVELFSRLENSRLVLDMAAAPGGKTTHLASKMEDRGLIVANDISGGRADALLGNLRRWGTTSTVVTNLPGERLGRWLPEAFDIVLLDAPC